MARRTGVTCARSARGDASAAAALRGPAPRPHPPRFEKGERDPAWHRENRVPEVEPSSSTASLSRKAWAGVVCGAVPAIHVVTLPALDRAVARVVPELSAHGFWDQRTANVAVELALISTAFGWQEYGGGGQIRIPALSLAKLGDFVRGKYTPLADVLRHEYAHAVADTHRALMRKAAFGDAFGAAHCNNAEFEYDPALHVTHYAATSAMEDFAEVFMLYLKHRGRLPTGLATPVIRRKWRFVRDLGRVISGKRRR